MQVKSEVIIIGSKMFNDVVEGTRYDNTKLLAMIPQKESESDRQSASGFDVEVIPFETSQEYIKNKLHAAPYPHRAELELEITTKGMICKGYKFLAAVNPLKAAA